jgi:hypothetical protein
VESRPSGIDCGGRCEASFPQGSTVTLTVRAAEGSEFRGWSVEGCSGTGSCKVTLDSDQRVIARFALRKIPPGTETLSVSRKGRWGTVTSDPKGINCGVTCEADFPAGGKVVLTADADEGYELAGWRGAAAWAPAPAP